MRDANLLEDQPIAWTPTPEVIERSRLMQFMRQVGVSTWDELYEFSITDVEKFTEDVLKFLDIKFDPPYEKLLDTSNGVEFPNWFVSSEKSDEVDSPFTIHHSLLNITSMCLDRWQTDEMKEKPAVIWESEEGTTETLPYAWLHRRVLDCAAGLRGAGIGKGDAVGMHMPMMIETVVALIAIGRVGAIAVPVFSGYGVEAIASRLNAVGAKMLITCDGFPRRGKIFDSLSVAEQAVKLCPTVERSVYVERINDIKRKQPKDFSPWHVLVNNVWTNWDTEGEFAIETTSAEDPLIILYTSGTTGKPKGIAHTHASFPIKAAQDMAFGTDVGRGTRICWYTDIGWMMGPWLIYGALINGATICIYDGAPDYPTPDRMWEFCAKHKVEVLGISPTLIRALAASEDRSADTLVRMSAKHEPKASPEYNVGEIATSVAGGTGDADKSVRTPLERRGWYRHKLPHFDGEVTQFITIRLADSLPGRVLDRLRQQLANGDLENDSDELRRLVEDYLDSGAGSCIFLQPRFAEVVQETMLREHGRSCDLKAWVIMPNHAHLLLKPYDGHEIAGLMKRIKGVSARKINQLRGTTGKIWQADYFDRYIRDAGHYSRTIEYIENNPVIAKLSSNPEGYRFGSAYQGGVGGSGHVEGGRDEVAGGTGDADKSVRTPSERHDLSSLRAFASTGEPWNPAPWWWLFEKVGDSKLPIINYSGGTEIAGGILMGNPLLPIKPCSFPAPCPGMDVDILDEDGKPVEAGKVGELVIKQPWIGMARGFWQEKERYLETYWRRFKGIWVHGDWAMRDKDGHWFILGRSDDTLKVAGKRVGPAEVESLLVAHPVVTEAAVIGVPDDVKGTAMVAFVVLGNADALVRTRDADAAVRQSADIFANRRGWHSRGYIPHFDGVVTQFITFRLADSLSQQVLKRIKRLSENDPADPAKEYRKRLEEYLDRGIGECILRDPVAARIVEETLLREDGKSIDLVAWVIMPNHAHVMMRPLEGHSLSEIMQTVKSVSAHRINKELGRKGAVWQPDYFDRYIRDAKHFHSALQYIENNPVKAGLCATKEEWEFSSVAARTHADEGVRVPSLEDELKALVAKDMGKPLAPSKIHFVSALPKTRNAKVMRRVIRAAYLGEDAGDLSALENPQALDEIAQARK